LLIDFVVGGFAGYIIERLLGANHSSAVGLPFKVIWAFGACMSTLDPVFNAGISMVLEILGHKLYPVWDYGTGKGTLCDGAVYLPYTALFGAGMTVYRSATLLLARRGGAATSESYKEET
jgi:hypothetical protein